MWKVPLFDLNYDDRERSVVDDVLSSAWLTMGERTRVNRGTAPLLNYSLTSSIVVPISSHQK